jgi:peptide/nickel transport system substrate-binding protein
MRILAWMIPLAVVLAGCGGSPEGETRPASADRTTSIEDNGDKADGDWVIANMSAEMSTLNPYTSSDAYSTLIQNAVFDSLLEVHPETLEFGPKLATDWESSEDHLVYRFTLRTDAVFHDGVPLTAKDVKFSFDTALDPTVDAPHMRNYLQDIESVDIIDETTVEFRMKQPYFRHLLVLGLIDIIPAHIYGEGNFNQHPNNRRPIGSGPYKFSSWETGQQVELIRNEDYWGEKPALHRRIYRIISNPDAALQVLQQGNMDYMPLTPEQWQRRASTPRFEEQFHKLQYSAASYSYIGWNARRPLFEDKRVRRALTMLLDRESIRDEIYYGLAVITSGSFFVEEPEYNQDIEPWPYDPEAAKALLAEAGWTDSTGNGRLDKDGREFSFEFMLTNDNPIAEMIATLFQESLQTVGIRMNIRQLEWQAFLQDVKSHNYDASILAWRLAPYPDPYQLWHSSQAVVNGSNAVGFINEEADRIIEEARLEFDREKRIAMYHRFHEILHEEQPYTFLFSPKALAAVDNRFRGIKTYPFGLELNEWWVPADLQRYP